MIAVLLVAGAVAPACVEGTISERLVCAERLLAAGETQSAEAVARRALGARPKSARARIVLARAAELRGQRADAIALLREVERQGPALYARRAAQLRRRLEYDRTRWEAGAAVGAFYDGDADPLRAGRQPAARSTLRTYGGLALKGRLRGRFRAGLERSVHLDSDAELAARDRTGGWLEARMDAPVFGRWDLGTRIEGRGAMAGRDADVMHHVGGGAGVWLSRRPGVFSPWVEARGLVFRFGEAVPEVDVQLVGDAAVGAASHVGGNRFTLRLGGRAVGPDGSSRALSADVGWDATPGPVQLSARVGAALQRGAFHDSARPRAALLARVRIGGGWALRADAAWRQVEVIDAPVERVTRIVVGGGVEWRL